MNTEKRVKRINEHLTELDLNKLAKLIPLVTESENLLQSLGAKNIQEFELKINERSGFVNALMSAAAYGFEKEYKRLLELEKLIGGRLSKNDLTANNSLKNTITSKIKESHTEYFTDEDLNTKKALDEILKLHNSLNSDQRKNIGYNRTGELIYSPFSMLNK